jgi:two-component system chemotaxis response regulator CheB
MVVIGASAGGVDAIRSLASALPADFAAAVCVVLHIGAHKSELPWLLNQLGPLRASHPKDGDPIRPGEIQIAPPDHHLIIERGHVRLTRGPRENWARPAIDPLFRSAAQVYGPGVIGVVLTGGLNDGTAGLIEVQQHGGTTVVQHPDDAASPSMPSSALRHVKVNHCLPLQEIPALLAGLVGTKNLSPQDTDAAAPAPQIRSGETMSEYTLDIPVAVTCPDCGGALRRAKLGSLTQFHCHIGHVYTAEVLIAAQFSALQWSIGAAMRALSERGELCRQMADKAEAASDMGPAAPWTAAMQEAKARAGALRDLLEGKWIHPGEIDLPPPSGE